jgi:hypothetical protein
MRIGFMLETQGYYNHEEEIIGIHVNMGNDERKSNERRDKKDLVELDDTTRSVTPYFLLELYLC